MKETKMFHTIIIDSPVGELRLIAGDSCLRAILWGAEDAARLASINEADLVEGPSVVLDQAVAELEEYFAGTRREFDLPLDPVGTPFQQSAWMVLRTIPYGRTMSYGEQARRLGDPNKARAVGAANGKNPLSIVVPCHRVIGSTGHLTGFGGGLEAKSWLLDHECQQRLI
jgi:methylated-DNA-[protein]-cysteine S-methyltransferase